MMIPQFDTVDPALLTSACGGQQADAQATPAPAQEPPFVKSRWMYVHQAPIGATEIWCNQGHNPGKCSPYAPGSGVYIPPNGNYDAPP